MLTARRNECVKIVTLKKELIRRALTIAILSCVMNSSVLAKAFVNSGQKSNYSPSSSPVSPATEC